MSPRLNFIFLLIGSIITLQAQTNVVATLTVHSGDYDRINAPVYIDLSQHGIFSDIHRLQLYEVVNGSRRLVASQVDIGRSNLLWWVLSGQTARGVARVYELSMEDQVAAPQKITASDDGSGIKLESEGRDILTYAYAKTSVPEGISALYSRGGFIHPLKSPNGAVLTRIQPPDHYHHYGIWNPWTHTEFEGREIDFWNLIADQGRVDVSGRPTVVEGAVFAEVAAVHRHVVHADTLHKEEKEALQETWKIRAWRTDQDNKVWLIDVESILNCASASPLKIAAYRYQGFGFRATKDWEDANVKMLTSEGFDKANGNATRARWCKVSGPVQGNPAGISFMTHPSNYNYPEQLRIWPEGANQGKENVFVNFNPAQDRDWVLAPGKNYSLRYRMLVYDGELDSLTAENYWSDFAHPPKVEVIKHVSLAGKRVLVYTKNGEGYVHDNISATIVALKKLGNDHGFQVDASEDPGLFTDDQLAVYDALIFSNTNNAVFDTQAQRDAFQRYIRSGGGFVGIHSATGSERDWPWFWKMIGGTFFRHPPNQSFSVDVVDKSHPSTYFLPSRWETTDECYFHKQYNSSMHVLLAADLSTVEDDKKVEYPGDAFGTSLPLAWCNTFDGGRQWYTALGHQAEHYENPVFMRHILGGIQWVMQ